MQERDGNEAVRQALINGCSVHTLTSRVVRRCQETRENWGYAAIAQLMSILKIGADHARALVSEHCTIGTRL